METEMLKIFNEDGDNIGVATREEVHKYGYWHETFHCWFILKEEGKTSLFLQLRSPLKKDFPNLLDITAAGHLLAEESVNDGIREVEEELGIVVNFEELVFLDIIKNSYRSKHFVDQELCHVYLFSKNVTLDDFLIENEEVSGILQAEMQQIKQLWLGKIDKIDVHGFVMNSSGEKELVKMKVSMKDFVPHEQSYFKRVIELIEGY